MKMKCARTLEKEDIECTEIVFGVHSIFEDVIDRTTESDPDIKRVPVNVINY